ncbi:MAG: iron-sulfur cluster assembly protein [Candidatus Bipolaricaulota bacterium]|nr:iron-sulfur cluster assembly protein [Candidatus Bipolaricaulota bacterium]MCS7274326.1 iron-sulfur cluster assembly protein [Candidatus Bipolaricaulota bacterium]MDW8110837.1 iron-sulfur cluster assembly protein [Candidatus Bipolaricaulota bacterium]MDW8328682.1 iron-sulfur cluster assembly protein [Candidatus Bipolaricaulota bacterium]
MTPAEIRELIRENVFDPELGYNVVDLGLLYDVEVRSDKDVRIEMTLTTVGCPLYDVLQQDVERAIKARYGDDVNVTVEFVFDPPWSPEMMSEEIRAEMGFI